MTITQMTALLAVLDYGGFTEAGKRLFMTQSAISQAISAIEDELQVKIFIRQRARAIRLTPVGERIVSHFRKVMQEVSAIKEIAALEKNPAGKLVAYWLLSQRLRLYSSADCPLFHEASSTYSYYSSRSKRAGNY